MPQQGSLDFQIQKVGPTYQYLTILETLLINI